MNTKRRNIIFVLTVALIMLVSTTASAFADVSGQNTGDSDFQEELLDYGLLPDDTYIEDVPDGSISLFTQQVIVVQGDFYRQSGKGIARLSAVRNRASKMKSTITLQVYKDGAYVKAGAKSVTQTVAGPIIRPTATFSVASGKKYRVKVKITATADGSTYSTTAYRTLIKR